MNPQDIIISSSQNNVSTCGPTDGSIDITTTGGTSPYTFNWNTGQSTEDISSLSAGNYIITVTDAKSLYKKHTIINITEPVSPIVKHIQTNTSCNSGNDGSIDISVLGGLAPYQYQWSNSSTTEDVSKTGLEFILLI